MNLQIRVLILVLALAFCQFQTASAASLSVPTYTFVTDSSTTPTNYDLSVTGTQDWQVYDSTFSSPTHKQYGSSITLTTPVTVVSPCVTEILGSAAIRSHATFNWTVGTPTASATGYNPNDSGLKFSNSGTVGYGVNYEQFTFVPGDTNRHTVHLYGYCGNAALLNLQFSNSLAGAASTTTNPPTQLGDFDYSVQFQADHTNDALTVIFTFSMYACPYPWRDKAHTGFLCQPSPNILDYTAIQHLSQSSRAHYFLDSV